MIGSVAGTEPSQSTTLIHIIGPQGSGKSIRGRSIIESLRAKGKTALMPQHEGWDEHKTSHEWRTMRFRFLYTVEHVVYDYLIIEHHDEPKNLDLQGKDSVIRMERCK